MTDLSERIARLPKRDVPGYGCPICRDVGQVETATGFRPCRGESDAGCAELARRRASVPTRQPEAPKGRAYS